MLKTLVSLVGLIIVILFLSSPGWTITFTPFGPNGAGGTVNGQTFTIGSGGVVFELDAFLNIGGMDLNDGGFGSSAQLSADPLPAGLEFAFSAALSPDTTDLNLAYTFINNTGGMLANVQFFSFMDAEIDEAINTHFNEYGDVIGTEGAGALDPDPDSWEIDEPGFFFGDIFDNLLSGALDNTNSVTGGFPDDVSMALGFELGPLNPLDTAMIDILISEDEDSIGSLALAHFDSDPDSTTVITMSGQSGVQPIPEPGTILLIGTGLVGFIGWRRRIFKR